MIKNILNKKIQGDPLEVLEKVVKKVVSSTVGNVSFKDFFPDLGSQDPKKKEEEMKEKQKKDLEEKNKNQEKGRNVEGELQELKYKKKQEEQEQEKKYQEAQEEKKKRQEEEQKAMWAEEMMVSKNPAKQKKKRGGAFLPVDRKSQTAEYSKKPD